mmetsp:Transcript_32104/g.37418  ORF Transcript_32104/g.37418 Transcript_32104/m.37418 type:complete len:380 (-) Transcript_32104:292-1431(-)
MTVARLIEPKASSIFFTLALLYITTKKLTSIHAFTAQNPDYKPPSFSSSKHKSPEQREAIVYRYFDGVNRKDANQIRSCFAEEAFITDICSINSSKRQVKSNDLAMRCMEFLTAHPDCKVGFHYPPTCGRNNNWVFAHWYETGTWKNNSRGIVATGNPMAVEGQTRFLVNDELKIIELVVTRTFTEWEAALQKKTAEQQPVQQPVQQTTQQPVQQPVQQPMQQSMQQPMQQPMQQTTSESRNENIDKGNNQEDFSFEVTSNQSNDNDHYQSSPPFLDSQNFNQKYNQKYTQNNYVNESNDNNRYESTVKWDHYEPPDEPEDEEPLVTWGSVEEVSVPQTLSWGGVKKRGSSRSNNRNVNAGSGNNGDDNDCGMVWSDDL